MPRIYLDLDGVMADFEEHYLRRFCHRHDSEGDDVMWANIDKEPTFFRDLPACHGALSFFERICGLNPIILTACPKSNYAEAARQKREWVREHLGRDVQVLPVMGGTNKPLFMHAEGDILIDDFVKNIVAWKCAGGIGILHRNFADTSFDLGLALGMSKREAA